MKKITKFTGVVILVMSFCSCRKNYTCTCTTSYTYVGPPNNIVVNIVAKSTKTDAQAWCTAMQSTYTAPNTSTSCSIK